MNPSGILSKVGLSNWRSKMLDLLLPRHCVACGLNSGQSNLCQPCSTELPRFRYACQQCGIGLSLPTDAICGTCLRHPPPWQFGNAGLDYRFPVDNLVCRFKFQRNLACGQVLGTQLCQSIENGNSPRPDLIIPVPLHRSRQFSRSFNQAEFLAKHLGRHLGIPVGSRLLSRVRRTSAQSGLDARERRRNIRAAFSARPCFFQHVALVDDVMTTGATLTECTRTLRGAGVARVSVWVAARADIAPSR